jgi:hypothetical protein
MPMNNSAIRNRKDKQPEKNYLLIMRKDLFDEVESIAIANDVSIAHFVRESVKRNLAAYKKASLV